MYHCVFVDIGYMFQAEHMLHDPEHINLSVVHFVDIGYMFHQDIVSEDINLSVVQCIIVSL